jgi:predicted dithiol-disulfide oxidoreductase (DUF899 family)
MEKPEIVSTEQWQQARDELLAAEKQATRALDEVGAKRRRMPMTRIDGGYVFDTPEGPKTLVELFDGRSEMLVYQFMDRGPDKYCPGCTWFTDNIPASAPGLLADKGITWVTVSDMPLEQIERYKARQGWTMTFVSSRGTTFREDTGAGGGFLLTVFQRHGDEVYRTYNTTSRGLDRNAFVTGMLDLTAYGRREDWEDSPQGWPQQPTYIVPTEMEWGQDSTGFGRFR